MSGKGASRAARPVGVLGRHHTSILTPPPPFNWAAASAAARPVGDPSTRWPPGATSSTAFASVSAKPCDAEREDWNTR